MFAGLKKYRTAEPALAADLERQNQLLERAFAAEERAALRTWTIVRVTGKTYTAKHGECVLAGFNQDTVITLPPVNSDRAGQGVRVVRALGTGSVTVAVELADRLNGERGNIFGFGFSLGFRDFMDDGVSGWWAAL